MDMLQPVAVQCPYCWESIEILVDPSVRRQEYIEDCPVCCRPITLRVRVGRDGDVQVEALNGDE